MPCDTQLVEYSVCAYQSTGPFIRHYSVRQNYSTGHDRRNVSLRGLQQPSSSGGKVTDDGRRRQVQPVEINNIDIGPLTDREMTAVRESHVVRVPGGQHLHDFRQFEFRALPIPAPVCQHGRLKTRVTYCADVRARIA